MGDTSSGFPHPRWEEAVNLRMIRSELEGGVLLDKLPPGVVLEVETENRCYRIRMCGQGGTLISGHPRLCPVPVLVKIHGSSWGGSLLRRFFLGKGLQMEFSHPEHQTVITSPIVEIRQMPGHGTPS